MTCENLLLLDMGAGIVLYLMGRPRKTYDKKKMSLMVPVTVAMHTKLKHRADLEGRSMAALVRDMVDEYLGTEPEVDFYDELAKQLQEALQS